MNMVDGFRLPTSLAQLLEAMIREGAYRTFWLKEAVDAYGDRFESDLEIWPELVRVGYHPMRGWVNPKWVQQHDAFYAGDPGFIPHPTDDSKLVCLGHDGEQDTFYYLDYRDGPEEPSVICEQEGFWRRVAPNFDTFINLFEPR